MMSSLADTEKETSEVSIMALARDRPGCRCLVGTECVQKEGDEHEKCKSILNKVPTELQINIAAHLDPVSQMCLGLTNRQFHRIFHEVADDVRKTLGTRSYNIRRYPFDLRMQVSVCGDYIVHGWVEFYSFEEDPTLQWDRSLGELLGGEKWLWRGVQQCGECLIYKPESAWAPFAFEEEMAVKHEKAIDAIKASDIAWYHSCCRRCRAKTLLVCLEKKAEHFEEQGNPQEVEPSVGLLTSEAFGTNAVDFQLGSYQEKSQKNPANLLNAEHETWEEICKKLDI